MDADLLIDHLEREGILLADAAAGRGWDERLVGVAWRLRELVIHIGGVHQWANTVIRGGTKDEVAAAAAKMGDAVPDERLLDWYRGGLATLVDTLRAAPPDLQAFTFLAADSPRHFWARRQAHETAIHRADAEGPGAGFDTDFAQDGIAEILAFGRRSGFAIAQDASLALHASDGPSYRLVFGGERTVVEDGPAEADATVRGTSSELYLWLWNRPSAARVDGDTDVAALWAATVKVSWS